LFQNQSDEGKREKPGKIARAENKSKSGAIWSGVKKNHQGLRAWKGSQKKNKKTRKPPLWALLQLGGGLALEVVGNSCFVGTLQGKMPSSVKGEKQPGKQTLVRGKGDGRRLLPAGWLGEK